VLVCNWQARLLTPAPKSDLKTSDVWLFCGCARESKVWPSSVSFALVDQNTHTKWQGSSADICFEGHQSAGRCPSIEELQPPRVLITVAATLQPPDRKAPLPPSPPPPLDTPEEDYFEEALPGRETPPIPPTPPPEPEQDTEPEPPEQIDMEADLLPPPPPPPPLNETLEEAPDENQEPPRGILYNSNKTKGKKAKKKKK
jgi:hypothetical protein